MVLGLAIVMFNIGVRATTVNTGDITKGTLPTASARTRSITKDSVAKATIYTGDIIQGKPVISQLNVADLEPGKKYSF